jgi:hypothetical protein
MNNLAQSLQRGVVADEQNAGVVFQQAIGQQFDFAFRRSPSNSRPGCD